MMCQIHLKTTSVACGFCLKIYSGLWTLGKVGEVEALTVHCRHAFRLFYPNCWHSQSDGPPWGISVGRMPCQDCRWIWISGQLGKNISRNGFVSLLECKDAIETHHHDGPVGLKAWADDLYTQVLYV
jgi:hypothetical protein